jgi:Fe-S cluster assembly protein SufD
MVEDISKIKNDIIEILKEKGSGFSTKQADPAVMEALAQFEFPDTKIEAWRKTNLNSVLKHKYVSAKLTDVPDEFINTFSFYGIDTERIVFVNGFFSEKHSKLSDSKDKIIVGSIKKEARIHPDLFESYFNACSGQVKNIFSAFNTAFVQDGAFILIKDGYNPEKPIHIINYINGENQKIFAQSRNLIVVQKNANAKIINTFHSLTSDFTFNNVVTELVVEENASMEYYLFEGEGNSASHMSQVFVNQYKNSRFKSNIQTLCGIFVRNEYTVNLLGENCETDIKGLYLPDREQHFDNYINVNHYSPNCKSTQLFKGIIDDSAQAVYSGKVYVARDAQKTDSSQSNKNILLTDKSRAFSRPQLEIYADDVACSHGSTVGQMEKEALFYLRSRGISENNAKTILLSAFINELQEDIGIKPYRDYVTYLTEKRLKGQKVEGLCFVKVCPSC